MKTLYIYIILMLLLPFFSESNIYAQKRSKQYSEIKAKVVDKEGNPIQSVRITVDEGIFESSTDKQGKFSLKVTDNSTLVFDVPGFEPAIFGSICNQAESCSSNGKIDSLWRSER